MRLALLIFLVWILSGITFSYFHECECPEPTTKQALNGEDDG